MRYMSTITKKGQMTLPKEIRDSLHLKTRSRVLLIFDKTKRTVKIEPTKDILDLAGSIRPPKRVSVLEARKALEKSYHRT